MMKEDNFLQNIWKIHTDVQGQMLKLRSVPVQVIPESVRMAGDKLFIIIDEKDKTDNFLGFLATIFNIDLEQLNLENGYIHLETNESRQISLEK